MAAPERAARRRAGSRLRVLVLGYVVRCPLGGMAWHYIQYLSGLARLGHDVYFLEDSENYPGCYDPSRHVTDTDPSYGLEFTAATLARIGFGHRWAYHDAHAGGWTGPCASRVREITAGADLLVNVSGANPLGPLLERVPVRVFLDTDPAFEQIRQLTLDGRRARARQHNRFFSFGENVPAGRSTVPDDGWPWLATRQPIDLDAWPATPPPAAGRLTTVMQWDSYPPREHAGRQFGMKSRSFQEYLDLPSRVREPLELALGSPGAPRDELSRRGWWLRDPVEVTRDPWTYQRYLQQSRGEFAIAKHGYVEGRTGWFSERSAAYLASGRPVIAQDTGFSDWMRCGEGVLVFSTLEEAVEAIEDLEARYPRHCEMARRIAAEYFDSDRVLSELVERAMSAPASPREHAG